MSEVVVTGIGSVQTCGTGREALLEALADGTLDLQDIDPVPELHRSTDVRRGLLADSVDLSPWLSPREARRMCRPSELAVAAANMSIEDAGLDPDRLAGTTAAVVLATSFGTVGFAEKLIETILRSGPEAASPFHFSESVANAPAGRVAIATDARGANVAVTQRESGPLQAVIAGAREILLDRASVVLVGTVDEITPVVHASLTRFRALASDGDGGEPIPGVFDAARDGFVVAEGSTVLVLERDDVAARRDATPIARVTGWARGFDPSAPPYDWGTGESVLVQRLQGALENDGIEPESVEQIVSGAAGSVRGDRLEAGVLCRIFSGVSSDGVPPVAAPKGILGEYGGGHLGAAVLAPAGLDIAAPPGFTRPDPELGIAPFGGVLPGGRTLVSALAAGGAASWIVLDPA